MNSVLLGEWTNELENESKRNNRMRKNGNRIRVVIVEEEEKKKHTFVRVSGRE